MSVQTVPYRCPTCVTPSFDHLNDAPFSQVVSALSTSAKAGCDLCRLMWWALLQDTRYYDLPDRTGKFSFAKGELTGWTYLRDEKPIYIKLDVEQVCCVGGASRVKADCETYETVRRFAPEDKETDFDSLVDEVINPWMTQCLNNHPTCNQLEDKEDRSLRPTRLIDVSNLDILLLCDAAHDIASAASPPEYLILSYCWGKSQNAVTTYKNLEDRQNSGFLVSSLPQTIQDAVALTRRMGVRYLWVDAICIVQPSKEAGWDASDWEHEAPRMGYYYRNAKCTIAASHSNDSAQGFLTERMTLRHGPPPRSCVIGTAPCKRNTGQDDYIVLSPRPMSWVGEFANQALTGRAWVFQEWVLSPRTLHFSGNGTFWECCSLRGAWEGNTQHSIDEGLPSAVRWNSATRDVLDRGKDEYPSQRWAEVLGSYCRMDLRYASDRLAAIQGYANRLMNNGDDYSAGVFRDSLAGLSWYCSSPSGNTSAVPDVPSWSWAAAVSKPMSVDLWPTEPIPGEYSTVHRLVDPVPRDIFPSNRLDFRTLSSRELHLCAPLRSVNLGTNTDSSSRYPCSIQPHLPEWGDQTTFVLFFDVEYPTPNPIGELSILLSWYSRCVKKSKYIPNYQILGLLLRPAVVPEGAFLRVGFVSIEVNEEGMEGLWDTKWKRKVVLI